MDIFRLWVIAASIDGVDVYEGVRSFLRDRLNIAGRRTPRSLAGLDGYSYRRYEDSEPLQICLGVLGVELV